jgi:peroxiredoxin
MKTSLLLASLSFASLLLTPYESYSAEEKNAIVGQPAPEFSLSGADGKIHSLSEYKGKPVVLEWTNPECPFVRKWYGSGEMQKLQKDSTAKGVVWLRINSNAPGANGSQNAESLAKYEKENKVSATTSLLDPDGKVGHLFGARTTPHMFVIDKKGTLVYAGGIDDKPSPNPSDIAGAKNYVRAALSDLEAGKPVTTPTAPPYGCHIHYK